MSLLTSLLRADGVGMVVRKSADETINNTSTFQDDDHLTLPVGAGEMWVGEVVVFHAGDSTADIKFALTKPSGATVWANSLGHRTGDVVVQGTADNAGTSMAHGTTTAGQHAVIKFSITNGATAGNLTLQWAQAVATVANTTVRAGSFIAAHKVG